MTADKDKLIESLSPNERKILPLVKEISSGGISELVKKSNLEKVSCLRALEYLQNKSLVQVITEKRKIVQLGVNGIRYKKQDLPERALINLLGEKRVLSLKEAESQSKLSANEFTAALGALKKKALLGVKNGNLHLNASKEELTKKSLEEQFIHSLPLVLEELTPEQKYAFESLKNRKEIVEIVEESDTKFEITDLGKNIANEITSNKKSPQMIEQLTPEIIKSGKWQNGKFRRYDVVSEVPSVYGGKRHFVNQAIDQGRKIWTELGFKEMGGNYIQSSFWNFDALFTAQDHPVREMQDTFFIDKKADLPDKKIVEAVKKSHEGNLEGMKSKGWQYSWNEEEAKRVVLRTHTTCLSAQTLYSLGQLAKEQKSGRFFAIGKNFRNETVDWSHGFEFNQTEGIVIDRNANFVQLLGYLKEFFSKMGFKNIRFTPAYFPYTEPSVEIHVYHEGKKIWLELGGAGIFRPEVVIPLLGEYIPVLAWGPGFDRMLMDYYEIKDLRELYKNDINQLRKIKFWMR